MANHILQWVSQLQAISQNGLTYSKNEFDIERYHQLAQVSKEVAAYFSDKDTHTVEQLFSIEKGYATPKLDVRAFRDRVRIPVILTSLIFKIAV